MAARYHRPGEPWPLYASLEPATAWAEWRAGSGGAVDPQAERRRLWRVDASDLEVLDLRRPEVVTALGVTLDQLRGARQEAQPVATRARSLGAEAMVVPSAAAPGAWNLVVFPSGFGKLRVGGSRAMRPPQAG